MVQKNSLGLVRKTNCSWSSFFWPAGKGRPAWKPEVLKILRQNCSDSPRWLVEARASGVPFLGDHFAEVACRHAGDPEEQQPNAGICSEGHLDGAAEFSRRKRACEQHRQAPEGIPSSSGRGNAGHWCWKTPGQSKPSQSQVLSELTEQQTRYAAFPRTSYPPKNGKEKRGRGN